MSVRVIIYAYRKPGLDLQTFKDRYEAHIELVKRLSGDDFPLSHKRMYVARTTIENPQTGENNNSTRNALTPATVLVGQQTDFDFDAYAELTFADQAAFQTFSAKVMAPEAAAQIAADEEGFLDRSKLGIALLGDVVETTN
ncbi:hypothetical protein AnigIFM56816_002762 [Aspergillus niger]|uniref:EthD domain-containing protein n=1 Tax=Aspergillus welwitschiae TaxID=1341132 RepID=A0A3F3Q841_9EURO|nr:EthD domain-containing protein [Aspergillus welwitschiae]RDH35348.1 EthD domain-containing protein [Aspergillus welwitschiae]GKZ57692.1 hypothetical protein AnigIFM49718_003018 [Aspergillus niger]GKZ86832.1 hypothetical protein AnigIFM56816_002762 [Aspergillus niger]GLA44319.1 hypothetical protein AnigIFM63309_002907 [Aspergillus niger]